MTIERLARAGLELAARRWPDDLSAILRDEWAAELTALRGRPWKMLAFAGSLMISPAVDEPSWGERAIGTGRAALTAAGVTLLGAALVNGVHVSDNPGLLVAAAAVMAVVGTRVRLPGVALIGLALFAFLLAGNEVAVMPFMGAVDIAPAVVVWTLGTALSLKAGRRLVAVAGTLVTLELATVAGSWHGADVLGTSPIWLPFHGDALLLANASAMAGPMLLCSVFVLTSALRRPGIAAASGAAPGATKARTAAGIGAALGGLGYCEWMSRTPHTVLDGSFTFGFGFAAHPIGSAAVALLIALLIVKAVERVADPM